jgi:glycosyltransferase involved in cell wall biosynthesis
LLEAASSGLPVIARRNYRPETVVDGSTGFLVGGDEDLFGRLGELIRNPELRNSMGNAGRQHAQRFDWDIITRQWESVFERLIVQSSRRNVA